MMAAEVVGGAFLSSFLSVLFDRVSSPEIINLIKGKKLDEKLIIRLNTTLCSAQALLNDAEKKQIKDKNVKEWLDNLKHVVYHADDLLDEVSTKDHHPGNNCFLSRSLNLQDREIVDRIESVIDTIDSIVKQKDTLGLKKIPMENFSWRITTSLVETCGIYGRDKDKEAIVELLLDDNTSSDNNKLAVIPIVGQGGIGKTTLAQFVYNDERVKQNFNFLAWVCVSEEFDVVKVTRSIIKAIPPGTCSEREDLSLLQQDLKEKLTRQRFLVVLDDAWNDNPNDWNLLLKPFQYGMKGSKILITTRNSKVASVVQTVPPHKLSLLSHDDCWLVFAKHALLPIQSVEYPILEKIGRGIVGKCKGLPLAAQALGGLLRGNLNAQYWNYVLKSEIWEISKDSISALKISYYYLPPHLKECFVFCSLYPKDYEFDKNELILLWMAENFIHPEGEKTLEEVGFEYFHELIVRSFLQPSNTNEQLFVMHDLMHDLAKCYAGDFYFRAEELKNASKIGVKTRHLSHNAAGNYPISKLFEPCDRVKHTRTFLEINLKQNALFDRESAPCILLSQLKYLKYLRVLSLKSFPLDENSLLDSIGELIHLRYLDLSLTGIAALPESLCNLHNLQTLRLSGCEKLTKLPDGMKYLVNLRRLDVRETNLQEMPKGMSKLKHLQILSDYVVGKDEQNGIRELGALENLQEILGIHNLENVMNGDEALEARMADKMNIYILLLRWSSNEYEDIDDSHNERDILDKLRPHTNLKVLTIIGYRGTTFPNWLGNSSYHNMVVLTLDGCSNCCMLPSLGQLPSLKYLCISDFDELEIIGAMFYKYDESSQETPFPSLETLEFHEMPCWREWHPIESDAFPRLKKLSITECPMLTGDLPSNLPALEVLLINECDQLTCSLPKAPTILELDIENVKEVRMQQQQQQLPLSLQSLSIKGRGLLEYMFDAITHTPLTCLQSLSISSCSTGSAISLPGACIPASLQRLTIWYCKKLEFPMQRQYEFLQSLTIHNSCDSLTSFPLVAFPNLTKLFIWGCENLECLVVSQSQSQSQNVAVSCLRDLHIKDCRSFVSFSTLGTVAPNLEDLTIEHCPEIDSFSEGGLPPSMKSLTVRGCKKLVRFLASMDLHNHCLTRLEIDGACESIKSFPKDGCLMPASLETLFLDSFPSLETLDCKGLLHVTSLQSFSIWSCPKMKDIKGERLPNSLTYFCLVGTPFLEELCEAKDPKIWSKISQIRSIHANGKWIW